MSGQTQNPQDSQIPKFEEKSIFVCRCLQATRTSKPIADVLRYPQAWLPAARDLIRFQYKRANDPDDPYKFKYSELIPWIFASKRTTMYAANLVNTDRLFKWLDDPAGTLLETFRNAKLLNEIDSRVSVGPPMLFDPNCPHCHGGGQCRVTVPIKELALMTMDEINTTCKNYGYSNERKRAMIARVSWAKQCMLQKSPLQHEVVTCSCGKKTGKA